MSLFRLIMLLFEAFSDKQLHKLEQNKDVNVDTDLFFRHRAYVHEQLHLFLFYNCCIVVEAANFDHVILTKYCAI
jgi:steroid 5-alpha reductase family enzyme